MSPGDQMAYMNSYSNVEDFFAWYNSAKAQYELENPPIEVGDGNVDLGDLVE